MTHKLIKIVPSSARFILYRWQLFRALQSSMINDEIKSGENHTLQHEARTLHNCSLFNTATKLKTDETGC